MAVNLKEGQVYVSEYNIQYHILAIWDDYVWTLVHSISDSVPKTVNRSFFTQLKLKYDVS